MSLFLNEWDLEEMLDRFDQGETPNLHQGAATVYRLMLWTDRNSDGWPYWRLPRQAAGKLAELLAAADRFDPVDCTEAELRKACAPIKAFLTRRGVDHADVFPVLPGDQGDPAR